MPENRRSFLGKAAVTGAAVGTPAFVGKALGSTRFETLSTIPNPYEFDSKPVEGKEEKWYTHNTGNHSFSCKKSHVQSLGPYASYVVTDDIWEHRMGLTGSAIAYSEELGKKVTGMEAFDYKMFFGRGHEPSWNISYVDHHRGVHPKGGGGQFNVPGYAELAADIVIPALIGLWNPGAGVAAALALSVDDFNEMMSPATGEKPARNNGMKFRHDSGFWDIFKEIGFTQMFNVQHGTTSGAYFQATSRTHHNTWTNSTPDTQVRTHAWAFKDRVPIQPNSVGSTGDSIGPSNLGLESLHPEKMTREQRSQLGIKRVREPDRPAVAQALNTEREVQWVATNVPFAFEHEQSSSGTTQE